MSGGAWFESSDEKHCRQVRQYTMENEIPAWFPYFADFCRNVYDFDPAWEVGQVTWREKLNMDVLTEMDIGYSMAVSVLLPP